MLEKQTSSRRLLLLFAATTVLPAVSLAWLGWRMVEQDRVLETNRVQERRDQVADLAVVALQRILAEAEEKLSTFNAAPLAPPPSLGNGAALLILGDSGVLNHAGTPLPYYPAIPPSRLPDPTKFAAAEELEFRKRDLAGALLALEESTRSRDPVIRGEAVLRQARIQKQLRNNPKALDAFAELGKLEGTRVSGLPAGLVAHQFRALSFEATGSTRDLQRETIVLCRDLANGRWPLTRGEFEFSYAQASGWLGSASPPPLDPDLLALAEAAESLWQNWRTQPQRANNRRERRTFRAGDRSVLLLLRSSPETVAALLIAPRFLDSVWLKELHSGGRTSGVRFALTDAEGLPVLGDPNAPLSRQSLRPASATQLPWTVHAIVPEKGLTAPEVSGRTRLLLASIAMMALLVLAGGYSINRAVLREVTVARLQSDFVASVSHEFRTPLTTVRQLSEMLARGRVSNDERRQQFYETLLRESERLHRLVEGLLNFGRMEAGELHYRFESLDPKDFVEEVVSEFQREVESLGYRIELNGNGALPSIRADRQSLARVFWNLLDNAVKYSPERHTIWVELSNVNGRVIVRVRDQGLGIPAAELDEIFRKFVRGAAAKTASIRGTGVGLAMARQIVAAHGGGISVESEPGRGTVFTVLLPAAAKT